jgi:hypothetical protein
LAVSNDDVVAFRLAAQHLTERFREDGLVDAAGVCAVQDSPPGSALLALHARVEGVTAERLVHALGVTKSLMKTWCMRGAPFVFPVADAAVFTAGVLPPTEEAMIHLLPGARPALSKLEMGLAQAVELCAAEIRGVLSGRRLAIDELGTELATRVAQRLSPTQCSVWEGPGPYAPGQPLGEGVTHFCIRILTLQGVVCFAPRTVRKSQFVLADEWLGHSPAEADVGVARAELLRRYLRSYGPSHRKDFAAWLGVRVGDVDPWWRLVEDELTPVPFHGSTWLLTADLDALRSPPQPRAAHLLPPRDPYTQMRDRETILDKQHHPSVWKSVGEPGAVLVNGRIAGTWRPRTNGRRFTVAVTTFGSIPPHAERVIQDEAEQVAALRGASSVQVVITHR